MSKHLQKSWGARHVYALGCFALVLASGAMADNTLPDSTMVYQLSDLDRASAAPVQIVSYSRLLANMPTPAAELATSSSAVEAATSSASTAADTSSVELAAKTTLSPGITIDGLACSILHTPTGKHRWSILKYDLSTDTENQKAVFVSDEERVIQSVACSADGSKVLMAIQDSVGGDSEVYLIDQTNHETQRLTDNETEDLDVSMSQDGRIISWQGRLADNREAVFVRTIAEDGSYTDVALGSKFPFTQPSLSDNGEWLVLVNKRNRYDHIMRYQVSTGEFTTVKMINSNRYQVADPSISNDGTKVLWTEDDRAQHLILADLEAGTRKTVVTKYHPARLSHPYLSGDGQAVMYSVNREDKRQNYLLVLQTGQTTRIGKALWGEVQYLGGQTRTSVDIALSQLNVTTLGQGSVTITPGSDTGYLPESVISLKATPDFGYQFVSWSGTDQCAQEASCSLTMPYESLSIVANFEEIPKFQLNITLTDASVSVSPQSESGYPAGTVVTLRVQPDFGYAYPVWQGIDGCSTGHTCRFLMPDNSLDIAIDSEKTVPVAWVTQLGTAGTDIAMNMAQGTDGSLYVVGSTSGVMEGQVNQGGVDGFIAKLDTDGQSIWHRQIGTSGSDDIRSITVDEDGFLYALGTSGAQFAGHSSAGGADIFLTKYSAEGVRLWLQQFGTQKADVPGELIIADSGLYLSGYSGSYGGAEAFVIKFDLEGNQLSNQKIGDNSGFMATHLDSDDHGNIFVAGQRWIDNPGYFGHDRYISFVQRINDAGDSVPLYRSAVRKGERFLGIGVNHLNDVSGITAYSTSDRNGARGGTVMSLHMFDFDNDFAVSSALLNINSDSTATYRYFWGSSMDDWGYHYIVGYGIRALPGFENYGGSDVMIQIVGPDAQDDRLYQLGSGGDDRSKSILAGSDGSFYVAGQTSGTLTGQLNSGGTDAFVTKIHSE